MSQPAPPPPWHPSMPKSLVPAFTALQEVVVATRNAAIPKGSALLVLMDAFDLGTRRSAEAKLHLLEFAGAIGVWPSYVYVPDRQETLDRLRAAEKILLTAHGVALWDLGENMTPESPARSAAADGGDPAPPPDEP